MNPEISTIPKIVFRRNPTQLSGSADILRHITAAVSWITTAQKNSLDGGIPSWYHLLSRRWNPSYPETTGYIIPTLFSCAALLEQPQLNHLAVELAHWLLSARTVEGGIHSWMDSEGPAVVFDTGQVIFGWLATWQFTRDPVFLQAATQAASWLGTIQSESGAWTQNQHEGTVKVIDTRVAWALLLLAGHTHDQSTSIVARRNLDWALSQQLDNGWFNHAAFTKNEWASTHALAYTAEGLLESGILLGERSYVKAAEKTAYAMLDHQRQDGSLAWTYNGNWQPMSRSSCLPGNCQAALLWLRLYQFNKEQRLLAAAQRAIEFVASTQFINPAHPGAGGGIAGSYPIYGGYARFRYPNWAAKFFIDSLLALLQVGSPSDVKEQWPG